MSPLRRVEVGLAHVFQPGEAAAEAGQVPFPEGVLICPACGFESLHLLRVDVLQDPLPGASPGRPTGPTRAGYACLGTRLDACTTAIRMGCGDGHRFTWQLAVHEGRLLASLVDVVEADA
jgi:hypothetical protein